MSIIEIFQLIINIERSLCKMRSEARGCGGPDEKKCLTLSSISFRLKGGHCRSRFKQPDISNYRKAFLPRSNQRRTISLFASLDLLFMENRFSFIEALLHLRFLEYLLGCFIVFLRRIGWNISGPMVRLIRTFLQRNGRRINDIRRNTLYEKCRVFPDNFVGKEAQRHKCREFCRQNVGFVSKARKKFVFYKTLPNINRTRDPHFYL